MAIAENTNLLVFHKGTQVFGGIICLVRIIGGSFLRIWIIFISGFSPICTCQAISMKFDPVFN